MFPPLLAAVYYTAVCRGRLLYHRNARALKSIDIPPEFKFSESLTQICPRSRRERLKSVCERLKNVCEHASRPQHRDRRDVKISANVERSPDQRDA